MAQALIESSAGLAVSCLSTSSRLGSARLGVRKRITNTTAMTTSRTAAPGKSLDILQGSLLDGTAALPDCSDRASRANAKSDADWNLCSGFFSRQRLTTRCIAGGIFAATCEMLGGS